MERKKDKDASSLFTLEPFQLYRQVRGLVHHAQPPAKVEFGRCFRRASLGVLATIKLDFGKKFARPKSQCERDGLRGAFTKGCRSKSESRSRRPKPRAELIDQCRLYLLEIYN